MYPPIEPHTHGMLPVGDGQELYWEECGNPDGKPALFLHGGPGGGLLPNARSWFDPDAYRIILFDQRGCGRSTPHAGDVHTDLTTNTTAHLLADIELLRGHLGVDRWLLFGGSWGSTLALAYAQRHPDAVSEIVLRGVWLPDLAADTAWATGPHGAARLFPEDYARLRDYLPLAERDDLTTAYGRRLNDPDPSVHVPAARAWGAWEIAANTLLPVPPPMLDDATLIAFSRILHHYFSRQCFLGADELFDGIDKIRHIPAVIVNGRYDMKTPPDAAFALHRAWPEADFHLVEDAGHGGSEPGTRDLLVQATDRFRPPA
ncbi:prolyl aminopeptidase [Actinomadura rupiterrae]|uniref:prolyl aminopeptidase n=1 Tax=Actinomadura rupiterrae TaxID=559627 RepID=UPI0020A5B874|nr:prolyl aminopeptidase [Actinomadura rupiterrae]MCP2336595.1 proline iminopeptidase [Actinomadura rupiterrae]